MRRLPDDQPLLHQILGLPAESGDIQSQLLSYLLHGRAFSAANLEEDVALQHGNGNLSPATLVTSGSIQQPKAAFEGLNYLADRLHDSAPQGSSIRLPVLFNHPFDGSTPMAS